MGICGDRYRAAADRLEGEEDEVQVVSLLRKLAARADAEDAKVQVGASVHVSVWKNGKVTCFDSIISEVDLEGEFVKVEDNEEWHQFCAIRVLET